jgi:hypothetical protein
LTEQSAQQWCKNDPGMLELIQILNATMKPVVGTGVRYAYSAGLIVHLVDMLCLLVGYTPDTLRSARGLEPYAMNPDNRHVEYQEETGDILKNAPLYHAASLALVALSDKAKTGKAGAGNLADHNTEKQYTAANTRAFGRQIYEPWMSENDLRLANE